MDMYFIRYICTLTNTEYMSSVEAISEQEARWLFFNIMVAACTGKHEIINIKKLDSLEMHEVVRHEEKS